MDEPDYVIYQVNEIVIAWSGFVIFVPKREVETHRGTGIICM